MFDGAVTPRRTRVLPTFNHINDDAVLRQNKLLADLSGEHQHSGFLSDLGLW